jgi:integrase
MFTTTGRTPVSGFSKAKRLLDAAMGNPAAWRVHDLRRTAATGMAKLGVNLPVIEKVLNHVSGSFAGVVGVYQQHGYDDEKRQALERWAAHVAALVTGRKAKVVPIRRGRA